MAEIQANLEHLGRGRQRLTIEAETLTIAKILSHLTERLEDPDAFLASLTHQIEHPFHEGV